MCKKGDIILVKEYISGDGVRLGQHPFIIIQDEGGKITGVDLVYDFVGNAMSSFKNEEQRKRLLSYPGNLEITVKDGVDKDGVVKADQFYYFDKNKLKYRVIGTATDEILEAIENLIFDLYRSEEIEVITANL